MQVVGTRLVRLRAQVEDVSLELCVIPELEVRVRVPGIVLALDQALTDLAALDQRLCRVAELRFFAGLSIAETTTVLGVSTATVERDWTIAKAWLLQRLSSAPARLRYRRPDR
jgi:DNA-directed RNA polymerase specialized sigma24 family protein